MSERRHLRGSRAAVAALVLAFAAAPTGASAHQPDDDCLSSPAQAVGLAHELVAALDAAPAPAPMVIDARQALEAANVVIAPRRDLDRLVANRAELDRALRLQLRQIEREGRVVARVEQIAGAMAWDRVLELDRDVAWRFEAIDLRDEPAGPWEAVADAIVTAARFPARAGIVVKHLVGAAAKLTPRVARALF